MCLNTPPPLPPNLILGVCENELLGISPAIDRMLHHRAVSAHPRTEANIRLGRGEGERDVDRKTTYDVAGTSWCNILSMYRSGWSASDVFFDVQRLIHESREEE